MDVEVVAVHEGWAIQYQCPAFPDRLKWDHLCLEFVTGISCVECGQLCHFDTETMRFFSVVPYVIQEEPTLDWSMEAA